MLITCCTGRSVPANTAGSSQGTWARLASTNRHAAGCAADASEILSGLCASDLCQKTEQLFGAITQTEVLFLAYQDASGQGLSCWTWVPPCRNTLQRVHSSTYPLFGGRQVRSPQCRTHTVEEKGTKAKSVARVVRCPVPGEKVSAQAVVPHQDGTRSCTCKHLSGSRKQFL